MEGWATPLPLRPAVRRWRHGLGLQYAPITTETPHGVRQSSPNRHNPHSRVGRHRDVGHSQPTSDGNIGRPDVPGTGVPARAVPPSRATALDSTTTADRTRTPGPAEGVHRRLPRLPRIPPPSARRPPALTVGGQSWAGVGGGRPPWPTPWSGRHRRDQRSGATVLPRGRAELSGSARAAAG